MAKKTPAVVSAVTLATIVAATQTDVGYQFAPASVFTPLAAEGLVEVNQDMKDATGNFATRATQKGIEQIMSATKSAVSAATSAPAAIVASAFKLESGVPLPAISGRGRGGNTYPFDDMEVNQSFFVANSEKKPNAAKSLASTVSSATARYATAIPGQFKTNKKGVQVQAMAETRKFVVRSVVENGIAGARVWRTA